MTNTKIKPYEYRNYTPHVNPEVIGMALEIHSIGAMVRLGYSEIDNPDPYIYTKMFLHTSYKLRLIFPTSMT